MNFLLHYAVIAPGDIEPMRFSTVLVCLLSAPSLVDAQTSPGLALAGYGYSIPQAAVIAAPGELVVVSVYGIGTRVPNPLFGGTPKMQLGGLSVTLTQAAEPKSVPVPLFGIQQTPCAGHITGCLPSTSLTVQIPFELGDISASGVLPSLTTAEGGVATGQVPILPVTDSLHILNSCDNTLIYYSLSAEVTHGQCAPMILHAHGPLVSASSPVVPGETLIMNVYGMGMVNNAFWSYCNCITNRPVQPFTITSVSDSERRWQNLEVLYQASGP
jgi:hypothetical protein